MNTELTKRLNLSPQRSRARHLATAVSPATRRNEQALGGAEVRRTVKSIVGALIRLTALGIMAVIVGLWLVDGGITAVHRVGDALTSAGRITGLLGAYLLLIQVLLLARLPFLEWIAGFDRLTRWHKLNGKLCLYLIIAHVVLITAGYAMMDRISIPAELTTLLTQYPDMVQASIGTLLIVMVVVTSIVIVRKRLRYETWLLVHLMSYLGIYLAWLHQIPTGNEFVTDPLAAAFWTGLYVVTLQLVLLFRVAQPVVRSLLHRMRVAEVIEEGPGVVSIRITGHHLDWLNAKSGQFFLWRFLTRGRWWESHPFSLSAAPDGKSLRITIKGLGDFSSRAAQINPGTWVVAEGPFGAFTKEESRRDRIALIAGGVGITPIRALIEELSGDVVVIYRAMNDADVIFRDELDRLTRERGITIHYVLGDHRDPANKHLMTPEHLRELVPSIASREIFLCGPPAMMRVLKQSVGCLGIPSRYIHTDEFAF